jgi:hypothetical protein
LPLTTPPSGRGVLSVHLAFRGKSQLSGPRVILSALAGEGHEEAMPNEDASHLSFILYHISFSQDRNRPVERRK